MHREWINGFEFNWNEMKAATAQCGAHNQSCAIMKFNSACVCALCVIPSWLGFEFEKCALHFAWIW